jgi:lipid-A-disaccharide synthase-like uncharacterized protein
LVAGARIICRFEVDAGGTFCQAIVWIASERQGQSVISISFSYWSIAGSTITYLYFIFGRDPVGILAYLPNSLIYIRNLALIRRRKFALTAAAPSQRPRELG